MKKLFLLLVPICFLVSAAWGEGPYVTTEDSGPYHVGSVCLDLNGNDKSWSITAPSLKSEDVLKDWAFALNEAHQKRADKKWPNIDLRDYEEKTTTHR